MTLNIKYNPSDKIWYLKNNAPTNAEIKSVIIGEIDNRNLFTFNIYYTLVGDRTLEKILENNIFNTQQELYESLEK